MTLIVKILTFLGILSNFLGSIMLLRDYRDLVQLPFHRWRAQHLKGQFDKNIRENDTGPSPSLLYRAIRREGVKRTFGLWERMLAPQKLRDTMRLNNEHDDFRRTIGLEPFLIVDSQSLNVPSVEHSFREIDRFLDDWGKEPDPEASTDRTKAIKLFVGGFALLLVAALLDLSAYVFELVF